MTVQTRTFWTSTYRTSTWSSRQISLAARFARMRDPARHRRHHSRSGAVAAAGLGARRIAADPRPARRIDRRRAGAGFRPLAPRHRSDILAVGTGRDRRPRRRNPHRRRRRTVHARATAQRRIKARLAASDRTRPRHSGRGQRLFAGVALSAGARKRRCGARRGAIEICAGAAPGTIDILPGKFVVEIKPIGVSKATAVCELMTISAVRGSQSDLHRRRHHRRAGIRHYSAVRRSGLFRRPRSRQRQRPFRNPKSVRAWLARIANQGPA